MDKLSISNIFKLKDISKNKNTNSSNSNSNSKNSTKPSPKTTFDKQSPFKGAPIPMLSIKDIILGVNITIIPWVILLIIIAGLIII
jgi:hypothetical protein